MCTQPFLSQPWLIMHDLPNEGCGLRALNTPGAGRAPPSTLSPVLYLHGQARSLPPLGRICPRLSIITGWVPTGGDGLATGL